MNVVDPLQFGRMIEAVENTVKATERMEKHLGAHTIEVKEMIADEKKRLDDHTIADELAMQKLNKRVKSIEDFVLVLRSKWTVIGTVLGILVWPVVVPFLQKAVLTALLPEDVAAQFISLLPW